MRMRKVTEKQAKFLKAFGHTVEKRIEYYASVHVRAAHEKPNGDATPHGQHIQLTGKKKADWRNPKGLSASRYAFLQDVMEHDPTKTMLRVDLVERLVTDLKEEKSIMQAFVGDMIKRELLRYVGT